MLDLPTVKFGKVSLFEIDQTDLFLRKKAECWVIWLCRFLNRRHTAYFMHQKVHVILSNVSQRMTFRI